MKKLVLCSLLVLLASCTKEETVVQRLYDTSGVERGTIEVSVSSAGVVEPLATVEVKSKASGEVLELHVENGDFVESGTLMALIDPRIVRNRLAQADAELKASESRVAIARTQMERAERLLKNGTFTEADVEQATLDLANAEAQVVAAQVSVENARIAVDDTDIRAPISGTVIQKPVEKGQVISSPTQDVGGGTLLLQMADLSAVQIRALVDETDIGKVRPGMAASVSVAAYPNQPFPGDVIKIEPQAVVEQNVTMFAVLVSIKNPDGLLLPGMNAEVDISIARSKDVLTIPVMALRTARDVKTTAEIIGMSADEIQRRLSEEGGNQERPRPAGRAGRPNRQGTTDYRFGGDFWVVLQTDAGNEIRSVRTGITDLDRVEIVSGLDETSTVLVLPSTHLVETQQDLQNFINRRIGSGVPGIGR